MGFIAILEKISFLVIRLAYNCHDLRRNDEWGIMQNWKHHRIEKDAAADCRVIPTSFHLDCGAIAPTT
jgi:hypothetical protein